MRNNNRIRLLRRILALSLAITLVVPSTPLTAYAEEIENHVHEYVDGLCSCGLLETTEFELSENVESETQDSSPEILSEDSVSPLGTTSDNITIENLRLDKYGEKYKIKFEITSNATYPSVTYAMYGCNVPYSSGTTEGVVYNTETGVIDDTALRAYVLDNPDVKWLGYMDTTTLPADNRKNGKEYYESNAYKYEYFDVATGRVRNYNYYVVVASVSTDALTSKNVGITCYDATSYVIPQDNENTYYSGVAFLDKDGNKIDSLTIHVGESVLVRPALVNKNGGYEALDTNETPEGDAGISLKEDLLTNYETWDFKWSLCSYDKTSSKLVDNYYYQATRDNGLDRRHNETGTDSTMQFEFTKEYILGVSNYITGTAVTPEGENHYLRFSGSSNPAMFGDYDVIIPVTVVAAEGTYTKPEAPAVYSEITHDQKMALTREAMRNRENMYYGIVTDGSTFDSMSYTDDLYDFSAERAGMLPDEGDYLHWTMGDRSYSAFFEADSFKSYTVKYYDSTYTVWYYPQKMVTSYSEERRVDEKMNTLFETGGELNAAKTGFQNGTVTATDAAKAAFDWVRANVSGTVKGETSKNKNARTTPIFHTAYSALFINNGVDSKPGSGTCQAFALLYTRLTREMGIPSKIIMGKDANAHTYNIVKLEDGWYYVDCSAGIFKKAYTEFNRAEEQSQFTTSNPGFFRTYIKNIVGYTNTSNKKGVAVKDASGKVVYETDEFYDAIDNVIMLIDDEWDALKETNPAAARPTTVYTLALTGNMTLGRQDEAYTLYNSNLRIDLGGYTLTMADSKTPEVDEYLVRNEDNFFYTNIPLIENGTITVGKNRNLYIEGSKDSVIALKNLTIKGTGTLSTTFVDVQDSVQIGVNKLFVASGSTYRCAINVPVLDIDPTGMFDDRATAVLQNVSFEGDVTTKQLLCETLASTSSAVSNFFYIFNNLNVTELTKLENLSQMLIKGNASLNGTIQVYNYNYDYDVAYGYIYLLVDETHPLTRDRLKMSGTYFIHKPSELDYIWGYYDQRKPLTIAPMYSMGDKTGKFKNGDEFATFTNLKGDMYWYQRNRDEAGTLINEELIHLDTGKGYIDADSIRDYMDVPVESVCAQVSMKDTSTVWIEPAFRTITFNPDGGTLEDGEETKRVYIGEKEYGELPIPLKAKYVFDGWYTSEGAQITASSLTPGEAAFIADNTLFKDINVTARWKLGASAAKPTASIVPATGGIADSETGTYMQGTRIQLITTTTGGKIYYSVDGNSPMKSDRDVDDHTVSSLSANSVEYTDTIVLDPTNDTDGDGNVVIKAVTVAVDYRISDVATFTYTLEDVANSWGDIDPADQFRIKELAAAAGISIETATVDQMLEALGGTDDLWFTFVDKAAEERATDGGKAHVGFAAGESESAVFDYSGKALQPEIRVYVGKKLLKIKNDYTLKYANNKVAATYNAVNAGGKSIAPAITLTLKGNYSGKAVIINYSIAPLKIDNSHSEYVLNDVVVPYNAGKTQKPAVTMARNGAKMALNKDYKVEWSTTTEDSTIDPTTSEGLAKLNTLTYTTEPLATACESGKVYWIRVTGINNYTGYRFTQFNITEKTLMSTVGVAKIPNQVYADWYDLSARQWINPDTKAVIIADPAKEGQDVGVRPTPVLTPPKNGPAITADDYVVTYENHTEIGTATMTLTAKDSSSYIGTKVVKFAITGYPIGKARAIDTETNLDFKNKTYTYDGTAKIPAMEEWRTENPGIVKLTYTPAKDAEPIVLRKGYDYDVGYSRNINVGTATVMFYGKGAYTGVLKKTFRISQYALQPEDIDSRIQVTFENPASISEGIAQYDYVKGTTTPAVNVVFNGQTLELGKDYTVKYSNNKAVAAYNAVNTKGKSIAPAVTVTGKGTFKGSVSKTFTILQRDIDDGSVEMSTAEKIASAKAGAFASSPTLTTVVNGKTVKLSAGTDYLKNLAYTYSEDCTVTTYVSKKVTRQVVRKAGDEVSKNDVVPAGARIKVTATGTKNYAGNISTEYRMIADNIAKVNFDIPTQTYTGREITLSKSDINAFTGSKKAPVAFNDYEIIGYTKNISVGTATVTLRGTGEYGGTKVVKFRIVARKIGE